MRLLSQSEPLTMFFRAELAGGNCSLAVKTINKQWKATLNGKGKAAETKKKKKMQAVEESTKTKSIVENNKGVTKSSEKTAVESKSSLSASKPAVTEESNKHSSGLKDEAGGKTKSVAAAAKPTTSTASTSTCCSSSSKQQTSVNKVAVAWKTTAKRTLKSKAGETSTKQNMLQTLFQPDEVTKAQPKTKVGSKEQPKAREAAVAEMGEAGSGRGKASENRVVVDSENDDLQQEILEN